jgi:hypothetical protein
MRGERDGAAILVISDNGWVDCIPRLIIGLHQSELKKRLARWRRLEKPTSWRKRSEYWDGVREMFELAPRFETTFAHHTISLKPMAQTDCASGPLVLDYARGQYLVNMSIKYNGAVTGRRARNGSGS